MGADNWPEERGGDSGTKDSFLKILISSLRNILEGITYIKQEQLW